MRLPLTPQLSTKDGEQNKNARLTNALVESRPNGDKLAVVRPALATADVVAQVGSGNGLVEFQDELISIFGATLGVVVPPTRTGDGYMELGAGYEPIINEDGTIIAARYGSSGKFWVAAQGWTTLPPLAVGDNVIPKVFGTGDYAYYLYGTSSHYHASSLVRWDVRDNTITEIASISYSGSLYCSRHGVFFTISTGSSIWLWSELTGVITWTAAIGSSTTARGVSDNGTVYGQSNVGGNWHMYRKAIGKTEQDLGSGIIQAISDDGLTLGGYAPYDYYTPTNQKPIIWTALSGVTNLSATRGVVSSVSSSGGAATGVLYDGVVYRPFRWDYGAGITLFDLLEVPSISATNEGNYFISADGSKVIGQTYDTNTPADDYYFCVWESGYPVQAFKINTESNVYFYLSEKQIAQDNFTVAFQSYVGVPEADTINKWDRGEGRIRSLTDLESSVFDFAQSTI